MNRIDDLVALLSAYTGDPPARQQLLDLAAVSGDPLSRNHFEPGHFTASGFVLSPDRGSLLLVDHQRLRVWVQPGGHIDPTDESVEFAARREVVEETGVTLQSTSLGLVDLDVHPIPAGKGEPPHQHFDVRFLFVAADTMLDIDRDEVNDAKWVAIGDVAGGVGDASVRRVAQKLLDRG